MKRQYLVELRKTMNLTQEEVAEKMGVVASSYSMIENGQRRSDLSTSFLLKLAEIFKTTAFDLILMECKLLEEIKNKGDLDNG